MCLGIEGWICDDFDSNNWYWIGSVLIGTDKDELFDDNLCSCVMMKDQEDNARKKVTNNNVIGKY